jgi:tRNA G18 (ribose-2'-O)-methylase SpoU
MPVALGTKSDVREWLKNSARHIVGTSSRAQKIMGNKKFPAGTAFLFGSEKVGLGEFWQDPPDQWVKIGIQGQASSLNLNASVACFLYEYNRMT